MLYSPELYERCSDIGYAYWKLSAEAHAANNQVSTDHRKGKTKHRIMVISVVRK